MIRVATALVALMPLAGAPAEAPVVLDAVHVNPAAGVVAEDQLPRPGSIEVSFRNTRDVDALDVVFGIEDGNVLVDSFDDRGKFSPNIGIDHWFPTRLDSNDVHVRVLRVIFADGTDWNGR